MRLLASAGSSHSQHHVPAGSNLPHRPGLQAWIADQRRRIYDDSRQALLAGLPRCLPPLTPSLDQAGGLQRLALRGHSSAVTKVLLTPSGTDAVTGARQGARMHPDLVALFSCSTATCYAC